VSPSSGSKIYTTVLFVVCGCKTWSLAMRGEYRLRVSENRAFRKMFGRKKDQVIGEWIKLHTEELCYLHSSANIPVIKINVGHMAWVVEIRRAYRFLEEKHDGERPHWKT